LEGKDVKIELAREGEKGESVNLGRYLKGSRYKVKHCPRGSINTLDS
jgi:hypothetical protein